MSKSTHTKQIHAKVESPPTSDSSLVSSLIPFRKSSPSWNGRAQKVRIGIGISRLCAGWSGPECPRQYGFWWSLSQIVRHCRKEKNSDISVICDFLGLWWRWLRWLQFIWMHFVWLLGVSACCLEEFLRSSLFWWFQFILLDSLWDCRIYCTNASICFSRDQQCRELSRW